MIPMMGIYKYTNKLNGKCYIGQSKNIALRFRSHLNATNKPKTVFDFALKKYGIENFEFTILEKCGKSELDVREKYYIGKYKSLVTENGYNVSKGGDASNYVCVSVLMIDRKTKEVIKSFPSTLEANCETGIDASSISKVCLGKRRYAGGYYWCFADTYDKEQFKNYIEQYEKRVYHNKSIALKNASRVYTKEQREAISKMFSEYWKGRKRKPQTEEQRRKNAEAHRGLKYPSKSEEAKLKIGKANGKPVLCVELNKVYYSASEAARQTGALCTNITRCVKGEYGYKTAGGYHWRYVEGGDYATRE